MTGLDALILAVGHEAYGRLALDGLRERFAPGAAPLILDVRGFWNKDKARELGYAYWRL
jgi:UDP-N-acetyl-D-galactosamine dehydrogenase